LTVDPGPNRDASFLWSFPIAGAREITATVDGSDVPVRVEPGGKTATLRVEFESGRNRIRLVIRRVITPAATRGSTAAVVAVNRVVSARVVVAPRAGAARAGVPGALGRVERDEQTGRVTAPIGPVDRFEVRWEEPARAFNPPGPSGAVDALYLWDAVPAG